MGLSFVAAPAASVLPLPLHLRRPPMRVRRSPPPRAIAVDYAAGFLASAVSTAAVYPVETYKVRLQASNPFIPGQGESALSLLRGIELGLAKECPNAAIYLGAYESLRAAALSLPAFDGHQHDPRLIFVVKAARRDDHPTYNLRSRRPPSPSPFNLTRSRLCAERSATPPAPLSGCPLSSSART